MNPYAVVFAAVSSFVLGGLWYSPVLFGISLLFCLLAAAGFAWLLGPAPALPNALGSGALIGALVACAFGVNYQFSQRRPLLWLIDGGYHLLQFVLFGLILGLWH